MVTGECGLWDALSLHLARAFAQTAPIPQAVIADPLADPKAIKGAAFGKRDHRIGSTRDPGPCWEKARAAPVLQEARSP